MDREARLVLETAVADLQQITEKLRAIVPQAQGQLRSYLLEVQQQSEAALRYHSHVLARQPRANVPSIAQRVAQAAFGASGVGLVPPQFALPASPSEPAQ
jgi:hypothetical protein